MNRPLTEGRRIEDRIASPFSGPEIGRPPRFQDARAQIGSFGNFDDAHLFFTRPADSNGQFFS